MPTKHIMDHQQQKPPPASMQHSVLVQGVVLSGQALEAYAAKWGLCDICCQTKTHNRVDRLFHKPRYEPITAFNPETGQLICYKGYCLQPTCHTLVEAQQMLGERSCSSLSLFCTSSASPSNNKRKSTSRSTSNNSASSADTVKKKPIKSCSSSSSSSSSTGSNSSSKVIGYHRSCSSGLDLLAEASESSLRSGAGLDKLEEGASESSLLSPQQQNANAIRQRMHASYSGPGMSSSSRRVLLSPRSPGTFDRTKSSVLVRRHGTSRRTSSQLMVGPITPTSSSSSLLSKKTPRRQSLPARGLTKTGLFPPSPPPPPPYSSLYEKQTAPRYRLKNNEPLASPSTVEIKVSPSTPTASETKRHFMLNYRSESSLMLASSAGMNLAFDEGTKSRNNTNERENWDQTVYSPATPDKNLKNHASISTFTPIAAERRRISLHGEITSPTSFVAQELEDAYALGNVPLLVQILQRRRSVLDQETASRALEHLRKTLVAVKRTEKGVVYYPEMASVSSCCKRLNH
jgi:hypothetical protein